MDGVNHLVDRGSDKGQKAEKFGINIDQAAGGRAINAGGVNEDQRFKLGNDMPGGGLEPQLADLTLEQIVDKEGEHIDENHGSNARVFVQEKGRDFQITFTNVEAGFDAIFLAVKTKHLVMGEGLVIGDQEITTISALGIGQGLGIEEPG